MAETRETFLYVVAIIGAWWAISAGGGKIPDAKPTELDRLSLTAKFAIVAAVGAVVFTVALLLTV